MRALLAILAAMAAFPTPAPPTLEDGTCGGVPRPVLARTTVIDPTDGTEYTFNDAGTATPRLCPGSSIRWYTEVTRWASSAYPRCWKQVTSTEGSCEDPPPEDPENFAPAPPIDPEFNEFDPIGPTEGPPGAVTVDKPAP